MTVGDGGGEITFIIVLDNGELTSGYIYLYSVRSEVQETFINRNIIIYKHDN